MNLLGIRCFAAALLLPGVLAAGPAVGQSSGSENRVSPVTVEGRKSIEELNVPGRMVNLGRQPLCEFFGDTNAPFEPKKYEC